MKSVNILFIFNLSDELLMQINEPSPHYIKSQLWHKNSLDRNTLLWLSFES